MAFKVSPEEVLTASGGSNPGAYIYNMVSGQAILVQAPPTEVRAGNYKVSKTA